MKKKVNNYFGVTYTAPDEIHQLPSQLPLQDYVGELWMLRRMQKKINDQPWLKSTETTLDDLRKRCLDTCRNHRKIRNVHRLQTISYNKNKTVDWFTLFPTNASLSWQQIHERMTKKKKKYKLSVLQQVGEKRSSGYDTLQTLYDCSLLKGMERVNLASILGTRAHVKLFYKDIFKAGPVVGQEEPFAWYEKQRDDALPI